jgi:O-glycosyl hydrolase
VIRVRLAGVVAVLCALGAGALTLTHSRASPSSTQTVAVTVDVRATRQVIDGFGSSERVWSDPHLADDPRVEVPVAAQEKILRLLYGTIGLTRVRDVLDQGVQKQPGGAFDFHGKLADDHVAYVKQARRFGLRMFFPGPVYLEPWMQESDPGATVTWAMAMLRRWRQLGAEPKYYAPLNEPWVAGNYSPDWMLQVVLQLGRRLKAEGFDTKLVIPDDENPADALRRAKVVLANAEARSYVGAVAYHVYRWGNWEPEDVFSLRRLATSYRLPLWMTEYSSTSYTDWDSSMDWAEKMHLLLAEGQVDAIDYLWGFFGEKYGTDAMISIHFDGGRYVSHTVTPVGWITAQYARFVRPGDARVAARSGSKDVLVTAYKGSKRVVVVATNPESSAVTVRIRVVGGKLVGKVATVRSSEREALRRLAGIQPKGGVFVASLPARSITTFVARR